MDWRLSLRLENWDSLKNEDDLNNEVDLKNEDDLKMYYIQRDNILSNLRKIVPTKLLNNAIHKVKQKELR